MNRHVIPVMIVVALAAGIYAQVTASHLYGYDDYLETHRAAFEDSADPSRILTTSHFDSPKYRPLGRAIEDALYHIGNGRAWPFRLKSVGFHIVGSVAIYALGSLLFQSVGIAFPAALIFALHPLANQNAVMAVSTVTLAGGLLLLSLALFVRGMAEPGTRWIWLALAPAAMALFIYESSIVLFGYFYLYLGLLWLQDRSIPRRHVYALSIGTAAICMVFFGSRALVLVHKPEIASPFLMVKNAIFFGGALLSSPADSLLAHDVFGTPLPSQMGLDLSAAPFIVTGAAAFVAIALLIRSRLNLEQLKPELARARWMEIAYLVLAGSIGLAPFLLFNGHPSETYLYLPVAFGSLVLAAILAYGVQTSRTRYVVLAILLVLFTAATVNRNRRVVNGARISQRVAAELPRAEWNQGAWTIYLAEADPILPRYGIYQYQGLATIDVGDPTIPGAERMLQMATGNQEVKVRVVPQEDMPNPCPREGTCFWVHADGTIEATGPNQASAF